MIELFLKYKKNTKKITVSKSYSSQDLSHLIAHSFGVKQKIIGITDSFGKFYDLQYVSKNLNTLGKQTFSLVTTSDIASEETPIAKENNISFASENPYDGSKIEEGYEEYEYNENTKLNSVQMNKDKGVQESEKGKKNDDTSATDLPQKVESGVIGIVGDLNIFQQLFLEENKTTIVICYENQEPKFASGFPYAYYLYKSTQDSIIVYQGLTRACDLYVKDWKESIGKIAMIFSGFGYEDLAKKLQKHDNVASIKNSEKKKNHKQAYQSSFNEKNIKESAKKSSNKKAFTIQSHQNSLGVQRKNKKSEAQFQEEYNYQFNDVNYRDQNERPSQRNQKRSRNHRHQNHKKSEEENSNEEIIIKERERQRQRQRQCEREKLENRQQNHDDSENQSQEGQNEEEESQSSDENQFDRQKIKELQVQTIKHLEKLFEDDTITELQFFKLKAKLFQNPKQFISRYQKSKSRNQRSRNSNWDFKRPAKKVKEQKLSKFEKERELLFEKQRQKNSRNNYRKVQRQESVDPEQLRSQIVRSKQEKYRYQSIINEFKSGSRERNRQSRGANRKHQIPIIVRKYNNVIQKISTSYPLSVEQEQAVNVISELELKGLISEKDSGYYKSLIIQEEPEIFEIFLAYFNDFFDQIQLSKKLKAHKQRSHGFEHRKTETPEQLMRLLVKHSKRNSFEVLRRLAVQNNAALLKCFDQYRTHMDIERFTQGIEKIATFYRAKEELDEDFGERVKY